jgi:hypothetical protein
MAPSVFVCALSPGRDPVDFGKQQRCGRFACYANGACRCEYFSIRRSNIIVGTVQTATLARVFSTRFPSAKLTLYRRNQVSPDAFG